MLKRLLFITVTIALFFSSPIHAQQNIQLFQAEPLAQEQNKGRNIASCLSGLTQFISAGIGYESFIDYLRDFFLWPMHYADVASIQNQVNKARYAVVSAFSRCDLNRLKSVTSAYYKLEAELYFVRHFVSTDGGFLHILTEQHGERDTFASDMVKSLLLRKSSDDEEKDRALFLGYFDQFDTKYEERAKSYKSFGDDPVYKELGKKFDELIDNFKSFGKNAEGLGSEGQPVSTAAPEKKSTSGDAPSHTAPPKSIKEKAAAFLGRFVDACVTTSGLGRFDITKSSVSSPEGRFCLFEKQPENPFQGPVVKKSSDKKTFEEVIIAVTKQELKKTQDLDKAELLTRYEVLYGEVNGGGIKEMIEKMNKLTAILGGGVDKNPDQGSIAPLQKIEQCAEEVLKRQCS